MAHVPERLRKVPGREGVGGEPLVETLDDACRTLANSDIEYLYLPEHGKMIKVSND